jgi:hypothetical protein
MRRRARSRAAIADDLTDLRSHSATAWTTIEKRQSPLRGDGSELNRLADDLNRLAIPVIAGFSIHPHWDHLLWHSRFGDLPRYATPAAAQVASEARERAQAMAAESASGIPLELIGLVTRCPRTVAPCRARSSNIKRTPSAMPRSSSQTAASCSPATCSPTS